MMAKKDLFNEDADSGGEGTTKISINKTYAKKYQKFKECQELDKLKQKYGDEPIEESSSESEDDDAEALTPQMEKDFLETLSLIKEKDPKIYAKDSVFFKKDNNSNDDGAGKQKKAKNKQPLLLKDYERQRLLEKGDKAYLSDDDNDLDVNFKEEKMEGLTYVEEQQKIKNSLSTLAATDSASDDEDLLQLREKDSSDVKEDSKVEKFENKSVKKNVQETLNRYWENRNLNEGETFLRDYILKKQFIDRDSSQLPAYNDVVGDMEDDEDSDRDLNKADDFERKFNFRFEEPDAEFIKQYPRTVNETVRKKDERRKEQRKAREERKKKEQEKKGR